MHYVKTFKICTLLLLITAVSAHAQRGQMRALLFTKTAGFHHESIHEGVAGIRALADRHSFTVDWQESPGIFENEERLGRYDVVIFLNTTGDIFNEKQQEGMEKFIQSGKGFVGIHAAADTEYDWDWYTKLVGRMFVIHPAQQTATLKIEDRNFPGMNVFPDELLWTDEWYQYTDEKGPKLNYLISLDESTYDPNVKWGDTQGGPMGFHPMSWYHEYDGGRAFYTGLGHIGAIYKDPYFMQHLYGAIYWAATGKGIKAMDKSGMEAGSN